MNHNLIIKDGNITKVVKDIHLVDGVQFIDEKPRAGSTNPVTSDGVATAMDTASDALREQIDDIAEKAGSGYIPKGESTVATLNALSGQENGELYTMTDAGTLTDGSLAVVAGDTVAWDATNGVWYKAMDYAPRQYGTNEVHNLPTTITAFRTGDVIPVDGPSGTAKMRKDDLLKETAENALNGNIVEEFNPTKDYLAGKRVSHNGKIYIFEADHPAGSWINTDAIEEPIEGEISDYNVVYDDIDLNDSANWRTGGVNSSTGADDTDGTKISTKPFKFANQSIINYSPYNTRYICAYDEDGAYLGYMTISGDSIPICKVKAKFPTATVYKIVLTNLTSPANPATIVGNTINFSGVCKIYVLGDKVDGLENDTECLRRSTELVNLNEPANWRTGGVNSSTGADDTDGTRINTKMFSFVEDTVFTTTPWQNRFLAIYDKDENYLGYIAGQSKISTALATYPNAAKYKLNLINLPSGTDPADVIGSTIVFSGTYLQYNFDSLEDRVENIEGSVEKLKQDDARIDTQINGDCKVIDLNDASIWHQGAVNVTTGADEPDNERITTRMIPFKPSDKVTTAYNQPWNVLFYAYDKYGHILGYKNYNFSNGLLSKIAEAFPGAVQYKISILNLTSGVQPSDVIGVTIVFAGTNYEQDNYGMSQDVDTLVMVRDRLYGKKWYACGDSFTAGVGGYTIDGGMYKGKNKVYPYIIGNRTGMEVHNLAVSGSTMSFITGHSEGSWYKGCFTYPDHETYKEIPADADYITLKFGINDENYSATIGTITDNTVYTLYGAWNVVMSYLLSKCPFAKIGIIVSNGISDTTLAEVSKNIAKRWGVAYLDENFGYDVPLLHRVSGKPLVCAEAHQNRLENFRVSANNTHPNGDAHEFESTFVEDFLRSL